MSSNPFSQPPMVPGSPVPAPPAPRSAYANLLANKNFRYWFASSFTSSVGDWMGFVALTALMTQLYDNSSAALFAVGSLLMIRLAPSALFGPIAGVIADRYDRRKVLVFTDLSRAVIYGMIAFAGDILAIFALTFIVECVSLLFMAAKDASLPQVVDEEDLTEANQLNLLCSYGTLPLGAVSTSIMIGVAAAVNSLFSMSADPLRLALIFNAVSFFLSALLLFKVHLPGEAERRQERLAGDEEPSIREELREGLEFIRGYPLLRALITGIVGVFFGAGVVIGLGSVFVRSDLGQPAANWSILLSAVGGGLVLGILVLIPFLRRYQQETVFPILLATTGLLAAVTALSVNFTMALVLGTLLGASAGVAVVQGYTLLQTHTEDATRARTFSLFYVLTRISLFAALGIGPFVAGAIGRLFVRTSSGSFDITGVRITIIVGGLIALYSGLRARSAIRKAGRGDGSMQIGASGSKPENGLFIVFEGVEGAGKSTQIQMLADQLQREGHEVVVTREPGGAPLAERIRQIVLDPSTDGMEDRTEALLIAAARNDHVQHTIRPALDDGKIVLSDRFVDSSLAYQGHARGLSVDDVRQINDWATNGVEADAVVLLKLDPHEGLRRVEQRAAARRREVQQDEGGTVFEFARRFTEQVAKDRMEVEGIEFHQRVADGFIDLAASDDRRYLVIDAAGSSEDIHEQILVGLRSWLPEPEMGAVAPLHESDEQRVDVAQDG